MSESTSPCKRCDGNGWLVVFGDGGLPVEERPCESCGGSGESLFSCEEWSDYGW